MSVDSILIEKALAEFEDPKVAIIEGIKRAFSKCIGIFALHRLGAFWQLLNEMNDIGMIKAPISESGIDIVAISNLLKDGFISVTKAGQEFFNNLYTRDSSEE